MMKKVVLKKVQVLSVLKVSVVIALMAGLVMSIFMGLFVVPTNVTITNDNAITNMVSDIDNTLFLHIFLISEIYCLIIALFITVISVVFNIGCKFVGGITLEVELED